MNKENKTTIIINILDILNKYSDENHRLSVATICEILENEYQQRINRKTAKSNLIILRECGYDIEYKLTQKKFADGKVEEVYTDWYLVRKFTDSELTLLIDTVKYSDALSHVQRIELTQKLTELSSVYYEENIIDDNNNLYDMHSNKEVFYTIELINNAIAEEKWLKFNYITNYDLNKKPIFKEENSIKKEYLVYPKQLVFKNGRYYLICVNMKYPDNLSNYRVDYIVNANSDEANEKPTEELYPMNTYDEVNSYLKESLYMFSGGRDQVMFIIEESILREVFDWFGFEVELKEKANNKIEVKALVNLNAMYYWSLQYGNHVEVIRPIELRERIQNTINNMQKIYSK